MNQGRVLWAAIAAALLPPGPAPGQTVYVCNDEGRTFVVSGAGDAPTGCRALADAERERMLSPGQPDIAELKRELDLLSARIDRLEVLLLRPAPRQRPFAAPTPRPDPFDTMGRTRDLGQDLDRRLDDLGR